MDALQDLIFDHKILLYQNTLQLNTPMPDSNTVFGQERIDLEISQRLTVEIRNFFVTIIKFNKTLQRITRTIRVPSSPLKDQKSLPEIPR